MNRRLCEGRVGGRRGEHADCGRYAVNGGRTSSKGRRPREAGAVNGSALGGGLGGGLADQCLLLVKGLLGKYMMSKMGVVLASVVNFLGNEFVNFQGPVAS